MIYICNPSNIIYGLSIFLYIGIVEFIIDPYYETFFLLIIIILGIYKIINYWKENFSINYNIFFISILIGLFNGFKYYFNNGIVIKDTINYKNNCLKNYYFIKIDKYYDYENFIIKKFKNQFYIIHNQPVKLSYISQLKNQLVNKIYNYLKNKFPDNYDFIGSILLNKKNNIYNKTFYNLGLGHYMAFSGFHIHLIFYSIYYLFFFLLWWPVIHQLLATIIGLLIIIFLTWINSSASAIRSCLMMISYCCSKWFYWPYNPWFIWFISFLLIHSFNPLIMYHPSFFMSFFLVWIFFLSKKNFWVFSSFKHKIFQELLINCLIFLFSSCFFNFFNIFYIIFNIICKDFFYIMILITFFSFLIPFLSLKINNFLILCGEVFKVLDTFSYKIYFFEKISFYSLVAVLFFLYCIFCIKFTKLLDLTVYLLVFIGIYNLIFLFFRLLF
jgi:hypothetical protein